MRNILLATAALSLLAAPAMAQSDPDRRADYGYAGLHHLDGDADGDLAP